MVTTRVCALLSSKSTDVLPNQTLGKTRQDFLSVYVMLLRRANQDRKLAKALFLIDWKRPAEEALCNAEKMEELAKLAYEFSEDMSAAIKLAKG